MACREGSVEAKEPRRRAGPEWREWRRCLPAPRAQATTGQWPAPELLINDLERAVLPAYPLIAQIKAHLLRLGAQGALMSGSGSAVFGVFQSRAAAEQAVTALREKGKTFLVEPLAGPPLTA